MADEETVTTGWLIYSNKGSVLVRYARGKYIWVMGTTEPGYKKSDFIFPVTELEELKVIAARWNEYPHRLQECCIDKNGKIKLVDKPIIFLW